MIGPYPTITLSGILGSAPVYLWAFQYSGYFSAYVTGEAKKPRVSQLYAIFVPVLLAFVLCLVTNVLVYSNIGAQFFHSFSYVYYDMPDKLQIYPSFPSLVFLAQVISGNPIVIALIGISYFVNQLMLIPAAFIGVSRCMFAWSFDRLVPASLADLHKKYNTPYKAIIVAVIVALVFGIWQTFGPLYFTSYWGAFPVIIAWTILGITA